MYVIRSGVVQVPIKNYSRRSCAMRSSSTRFTGPTASVRYAASSMSPHLRPWLLTTWCVFEYLSVVSFHATCCVFSFFLSEKGSQLLNCPVVCLLSARVSSTSGNMVTHDGWLVRKIIAIDRLFSFRKMTRQSAPRNRESLSAEVCACDILTQKMQVVGAVGMKHSWLKADYMAYIWWCTSGEHWQIQV